MASNGVDAATNNITGKRIRMHTDCMTGTPGSKSRCSEQIVDVLPIEIMCGADDHTPRLYRRPVIATIGCPPPNRRLASLDRGVEVVARKPRERMEG
jgi:hypothetical protein